jgi:hypothetical protein
LLPLDRFWSQDTRCWSGLGPPSLAGTTKDQPFSNFVVIVASKWILSLIASSPLMRGKSVHDIPFRVDLNFFSPAHTDTGRKRFGMADDSREQNISATLVVSCILTRKWLYWVCMPLTSRRTLPTDFRWWSLDGSVTKKSTKNILAASEIVLMPSIAGAFGRQSSSISSHGRRTQTRAASSGVPPSRRS